MISRTYPIYHSLYVITSYSIHYTKLYEAIEALKGLEDVEAATEPEADDSQEGMDLA